MTKKKNKILTFIFSLIPGAGEMYMGFMKQGLSLMCMFFASIMLAIWIRADVLLFVNVVIWFYSFFHVHNLRALSDERFAQEKDKLIIPFSGEEPVLQFHVSNGRLRTVVAIVLIFVGAGMLWNNLLDMISRYLPYWMYDAVWQIAYNLPEVAVSILVIWLGVRLIMGKKKELLQEARTAQIGQHDQMQQAAQDGLNDQTKPKEEPQAGLNKQAGQKEQPSQIAQDGQQEPVAQIEQQEQ